MDGAVRRQFFFFVLPMFSFHSSVWMPRLCCVARTTAITNLLRIAKGCKNRPSVGLKHGDATGQKKKMLIFTMRQPTLARTLDWVSLALLYKRPRLEICFNIQTYRPTTRQKHSEGIF